MQSHPHHEEHGHLNRCKKMNVEQENKNKEQQKKTHARTEIVREEAQR